MDCSLQARRNYMFPWDFPSKNTGVSCHFFFQWIFLTQVSNPHLYFRAGSLLTETLHSDIEGLAWIKYRPYPRKLSLVVETIRHIIQCGKCYCKSVYKEIQTLNHYIPIRRSQIRKAWQLLVKMWDNRDFFILTGDAKSRDILEDNLLISYNVKHVSVCSIMSNSLQPHGL